MRPDLSLLTEPGYDAATQLWLKPSDNVQLPPTPKHPTRDEAMKALRLLNDLLAGFPFEGETKEKKTSVSRAAALAGIMTTVARGALKAAVPLFVVTAPDARTGKTYLVELIALIATGHVPVSSAGSEDDTEFEKRVETAAQAARAIMHFNNLPEHFVVKSVRLAELSTEGVVNIRKLGRHEEGQCDCRATTAFINGTNISLSGDLVLRAVSCRLNAQMEHPEERTFAFKPDQWVRANRSAYLNAVFTIIKAFAAAGAPRPKAYKIVTGFEQWSKRIQQALIWLGMEDPMGAMEAMRAIDPEQENLQRLLKVLRECLTTTEERRAFTVALCEEKANEIKSRGEWNQPIYKYPELREVMSLKGQINGRHFGRLLMNVRDKIRDEWCIRLISEKGKSNSYCLLGPEQPAAAGDRPM
jgi:putative DNA primase/helicase